MLYKIYKTGTVPSGDGSLSFKFRAMNTNIFLFIFTLTFLVGFQIRAQELQVKGRVTTFENFGLNKVSVKAKKSGAEAMSDTAGYYSIVCDVADKLVFDANGFFREKVNLKKIEPGDSVNVNLKLKKGDKNSKVATGYGHIEEEKLTYAIKKFESGPDYSSYNSILEVIEGRVSGVSIGYSGINIRGASSINEGPVNALLVVDGTIVSYSVFKNIPPTNVNSINILKGAAASARYGSRGMGGVIVIETKSK